MNRKEDMEIKSLADIGFDTLFEAFEQAFAEYEVQQDREQLRRMLQRRGFDPRLSFGAFEGDQIVAFTLNGIGNYNGIPTAYDTGSGTLKAYRGQGLATAVFEYAVPRLKAANIAQYLLEVLQHNTKAVSVYRNLGFETTREFNYFIQQEGEIRSQTKDSGSTCIIRRIDPDRCAEGAAFWDFRPSWQNSFESVARAHGAFVCLGAFVGDNLVGYGIFEPASGDVTQIAVAPEYRRRGIGSELLARMSGLNEVDMLKIINTEVGCEAMTRFLASKNIPVGGQQFEMIKKI